MTEKKRTGFRPKKGKPVVEKPVQPVPEPEPEAPPEGEQTAPAKLPQGQVQTRNPKGQSYQVDWSRLTRWDQCVEEASREFNVPKSRIYGHMLIESQGEPNAIQKNNANGWSYGLMQVVPRYWRALIGQLAGKNFATEDAAGRALLDNPCLAVRAGAAVLRRYYDEQRDWNQASSHFFTGKPNWQGADNVNGTRGGDYKRTLNQAIAEFEAAAGGTKPPPPPKETDPYKILLGGNYPPITYGWLADAGLNYYGYGVGHGTQRATQHTGDDIGVACGTPLYAPASGVVDCVGAAGTPRWGQACGAYADVDGGGKGNLTIMLDSGIKLTLGHVREVFVKPGDRVKQGQKVATVGSMNGCHVHVEVAENRNGTYWLVSPKQALAKAIGSEPTPGPDPDLSKPVVFGRVPHPPFQDRIISNNTAWSDLGPRRIVGSCRHSMVGSLAGTDAYFRGEARNSALTDYGIGGATDGALDGVIYRWNDPRGRRAPHANGPTNDLQGDGPAFVRVYGVNGVNRDLVSIERSDGGNTNTPLSERQFESIAQLEAYWADQAQIPWHSFPVHPASGVVTDMEHWEFGPKECPFAPVRSQTTRLQNRIRAILKEWQIGVKGEPDVPPPGPVIPKNGYPVGMDEDLARELFGFFTTPSGAKVGFDPSPKGVVSAAWLSRGDAENEFPSADSWIETPSGKRIFTFANGWSLVHDPAQEKRDWYWLGDEEGELEVG